MEIDNTKDKPWKENLSLFLKDPNRQNLRQLLQLEAVEDNDLEFKRELLSFDLLSKHILAMANKNGGAIVFGVDEVEINQFSPCGLSESLDITDIQKKLSIYIPKNLETNIIPHYFKDEQDIKFKGKMFLIVIIGYNPRYLPFLALKHGSAINRSTIYTRRNGASEPINYDELQDILNNRISTEYSTTNELKLVEHLEELKELYAQIPKRILSTFYIMQAIQGNVNPEYPKESYEDFICKVIEIKKEVIISLIKR
jgi:predicted HTH transcriptional regulator